MSRKRTGLRNRNRGGKSTYSRLHKGRNADRYGKFTGQGFTDTIAGRTFFYAVRSGSHALAHA